MKHQTFTYFASFIGKKLTLIISVALAGLLYSPQAKPMLNQQVTNLKDSLTILKDKYVQLSTELTEVKNKLTTKEKKSDKPAPTYISPDDKFINEFEANAQNFEEFIKKYANWKQIEEAAAQELKEAYKNARITINDSDKQTIEKQLIETENKLLSLINKQINDPEPNPAQDQLEKKKKKLETLLTTCNNALKFNEKFFQTKRTALTKKIIAQSKIELAALNTTLKKLDFLSPIPTLDKTIEEMMINQDDRNNFLGIQQKATEKNQIDLPRIKAECENLIFLFELSPSTNLIIDYQKRLNNLDAKVLKITHQKPKGIEHQSSIQQELIKLLRTLNTPESLEDLQNNFKTLLTFIDDKLKFNNPITIKTIESWFKDGWNTDFYKNENAFKVILTKLKTLDTKKPKDALIKYREEIKDQSALKILNFLIEKLTKQEEQETKGLLREEDKITFENFQKFAEKLRDDMYTKQQISAHTFERLIDPYLDQQFKLRKDFDPRENYYNTKNIVENGPKTQSIYLKMMNIPEEEIKQFKTKATPYWTDLLKTAKAEPTGFLKGLVQFLTDEPIDAEGDRTISTELKQLAQLSENFKNLKEKKDNFNEAMAKNIAQKIFQTFSRIIIAGCVKDMLPINQLETEINDLDRFVTE